MLKNEKVIQKVSSGQVLLNKYINPLKILHYFQDLQATPDFVWYAEIDLC